MKRVLILLGVFCSISVCAQEIAISGRVTEGDSDVALEFATVTIHENEAGTLISGAICDQEGRFNILGSFGG